MRTHSKPLTRQFCQSNDLVFYPDDKEEARFIQERLAKFGIRWAGGRRVGSLLNACVNDGMIVLNGTLYHGPYERDSLVRCTADQFDRNYIPPERRYVMDQFNRLADRIEGLVSRIESMEKKIDELHAELYPAVENTKPGLKKPGGPAR